MIHKAKLPILIKMPCQNGSSSPAFFNQSVYLPSKVQHRFLYEEKTDNLKKLLEKEDFETSNIVANIEKDWPEKNIAK